MGGPRDQLSKVMKMERDQDRAFHWHSSTFHGSVRAETCTQSCLTVLYGLFQQYGHIWQCSQSIMHDKDEYSCGSQ